MANIMTTYVKICNLNEETFIKAKELFETEGKNNADVKVVKHFNKLFGTEFNDTDNFPDRKWMDENIGAKWIRIEFDSVDYSPEVDVHLESAWNVPNEYIQKVVEVLNEFDKNIVAYGTYEDESYSPIGAFVYGFDYDDIEDYDEVDGQRMWDDEDYMYQIMDELHDHRDSMYEGYLEVKKEREEEQN
jgi:hypothetical protein